MSANVWVLAALLIGALFTMVALALARRRPSLPAPDVAQAAPPVVSETALAELETSPELETSRDQSPPRAADPAVLDPVHLAALVMAKSAYDIAQHLGFDAMPDRAQPSVRKLRVPLRSDLERRAAVLLASGAHPCVSRVEIARDERHALAFVDLSAAPPL